MYNKTQFLTKKTTVVFTREMTKTAYTFFEAILAT